MLTIRSDGAIAGRLKINNFDGLRLIFAAMVVLFHISILSQSPSLAWMSRFISATFAVQAFFFVSGFLVVMSWENSFGLLPYAKKRLFRIAPAYVVVVVGAALLLSLVSDLGFVEYYSSPQFWRYLSFNLVLANFNEPGLPGVFLNNHEMAINGSLWTIKIEVMFYCLVPFIVFLARRFGYKRVLPVIFIGSIFWKGGFSYAAQATESDMFFRLSKQLPGQLSFFMAGSMAYYRTRDGLRPVGPIIAALSLFGYALSDGLLHESLAPIFVGCMVYFAAVGLPSLWSAKRIGDVSYGLYLYHFPLVQTLVAIGLFDSNPLGATFLLISVVPIVAYISWWLIEKPSLVFAHNR
ncbi:MAG: acyltransferase [Rhodocyclaceae bacterium]